MAKYEGKNLFVTPDGTIHVDEAGKLTNSTIEEATGTDEQTNKRIQLAQCCSINTSESGSIGYTFKLKFRKKSNQYVYIYHYREAGNVHLGTSIITTGGCQYWQSWTNPLPYIPSGTTVKSDAFIYDGSYCTREVFTWTKNF